VSARRTTLAAALAALAAAAAPAPAAAQAPSKADAFAGKIPPVSGQLYRKAGRVELTASGNLSLNDAFFTKYFGGLKATYHFTEHLSAGLQGAGGAAVQTDSTVVCSSSRGCADADATSLRQVPGRIRWIVGAEAAWSPVYGKLNVLSEQVAHLDFSILAGPDVVAHDEVLSREAAATQTPGVVTSFGGHVGLGMRIFLAGSVALRLEVKDYIYSVNVPNGGIGSDLQNQLFAELGISLFLPGRSRPTR
jgi:outer membrane beta-barrel protein